MKATTPIKTLLTASALLLAGSLQAQPPMPSPIQMFDKDGNGTVSEQEFNEGRAARMAERAKAGRPMRNAANAPKFSDIDTDGDGEATMEEFITMRRAMMEKMRAERMAQRPPMRGPMGYGPRPGMGPGRHHPGGCMHGKGKGMHGKGHHGKHGMHHGKGKPRYTFKDIDLDGDGMISPEEFEKHHQNR